MRPFFIAVLLFSFTLTSCATRVVHRTPSNKTVVVKTAPKNHQLVVVKGQRYYKWNGNHYKKTSRGYLLVRI